MDNDEIPPLNAEEVARLFERATASPHFESAMEEIHSYISLLGCKGRDETLEALRILMIATSMATIAVRMGAEGKKTSPPVMH